MGPIWDFDLGFGNVDYDDPEYPQGLFPDSSPTYPQGLYSSAPGAHGEVGSAVGLYLESGFRIVHRATKDTYMYFHAVAPFLSYSLNSSD